MLTCQFIAWVLAAVKRVDVIVLAARVGWESMRELMGARSLKSARDM